MLVLLFFFFSSTFMPKLYQGQRLCAFPRIYKTKVMLSGFYRSTEIINVKAP